MAGRNQKHTIAICDDEPIQVDTLKIYIEEYINKNKIAAEFVCFNSGEEIIRCSKIKAIDILFLDMQMSGLDGIETAKLFREKNNKALLIFVTAYKDYVMKAFEVDTFRYLIKPVENNELKMVMEKIISRINNRKKRKETNDSLCISFNQKQIIIKYCDVYYFEKFLHKIIVHAITQKYEFYCTFKKILNMLPDYFIQVHQGYIVNTKYIKEIDGLDIILDNDNKIKASRNRIKGVKKFYLNKQWRRIDERYPMDNN